MKKKALSLALAFLLTLALVPMLTPSALAKGDVYATVSAGGSHTLVIKDDSSLWANGNNVRGQLGDTGSVWNSYSGWGDSTVPVKVMDGVIAVSAGGVHTMMIKADATLWALGSNGYGERGDGTGGTGRSDFKSDINVPVKVMDNVIAVSASTSHTMAIRSDKSLWGWGDNTRGQLGNGESGPNKRSLTPIKVMDDVVAVSTGNGATMVIKSDKSLWGFGWNGGGALGVDRINIAGDVRTTPVKIMDGVAAVSVGNGHTMILKDDGRLYACGANDKGQLGDGTVTSSYEDGPRTTPVKIMDNVAAVSAGFNHSTAIKQNGDLYAWGDNICGQLGNGEDMMSTKNTNLNSPIPIKVMDGVAAVSAGDYFTIAIKENGSLWTFGNNGEGVFGNGTFKSSTTPIEVGSGVKLPLNAVVPPNPIDSASSWSRTDIQNAIAKGFVPAGLQNNYKNTITRAEFCALAVKWLEYKTNKSIDTLLSEQNLTRDTAAFTDTKDPDILAAYALKITSGAGNNQFNPTGSFDRQQAATMIRNACKVAGMDVTNTTPAGFQDINTASTWAVDGINLCANGAIMSGTSTVPLLFSPTAPYSREQSIMTFNNIK